MKRIALWIGALLWLALAGADRWVDPVREKTPAGGISTTRPRLTPKAAVKRSIGGDVLSFPIFENLSPERSL